MAKASFLRRLFKRSSTSNPQQWYVDWVSGGNTSSAGVNITEDKALTYTPFWAAVRVISGAISSLPLIWYRKTADGKERAENHPVYRLLHNQPNEYMTAMTFIETRMAHALVYGNGYAEIERDGNGRPVALWPLLPDKTAKKITDGPVKFPFYEVTLSTGSTVQVPDYNVLHVPGLGFDGFTGYPVAQYHKEAIGLGMATKKFGASFFGNGAIPGGVLEMPGEIKQEQAKLIRKQWEELHWGLDKSHRIAILEAGTQYKQMGVNPNDAQCLETQKFSVDDVARIFCIPPHKIGSMERATFSNIEQQSLDFLTQTLYYWMRKWEQEVNNKLVMPNEQNRYFAEFLSEAFLRGDTASRYSAYAIGRQWGWLSINDVRRMENMNSIGEDGDGYMEPLNMRPAGEPPPEPTPPSPPSQDDSNQDDVAQNAVKISLLTTVMTRLLRREANAVSKIAKENGDIAAWYAGHQLEICKTLERLFSPLKAADLAEKHCQNSLKLLQSQPKDTIPGIVDAWDMTRASELLDYCLEDLHHARANAKRNPHPAD